MSWYGVKLLLKAEDANGEEHLAEESIRILSASSLDEAYEIASERYKHIDSNKVKCKDIDCEWKLKEVLDVFDIYDELKEDTEIYSKIILPEEALKIREIYYEN